MGKYTLGVWMTAIGVSMLVAINVGIASGVASLFVVWGVAYMVTGTLEGVIKAVFANVKALKE